MPQMSGFDLLDRLGDVPQGTFTTAYDAYAIKPGLRRSGRTPAERLAIGGLLQDGEVFVADRVNHAQLRGLPRLWVIRLPYHP